jgi:hypothetical protein
MEDMEGMSKVDILRGKRPDKLLEETQFNGVLSEDRKLDMVMKLVGNRTVKDLREFLNDLDIVVSRYLSWTGTEYGVMESNCLLYLCRHFKLCDHKTWEDEYDLQMGGAANDTV